MGYLTNTMNWIRITLILAAVVVSNCLAELHGVRLRHDNFDCYDHRPKIANGYYEVLRGDGHVIRAHCDPGFLLVGAGLRLCQLHEKRFTGDEPKCEDIDECELLSNTTDTEEGSAYGNDDGDVSDAPEPCHRRAHCINAPGSYRCECGEGLRGSGFHCAEPRECAPPPTPAHAHVLQKSPNIIRFYCHPDYSIQGNDTLVCKDGTWSSLPPVCVPGWKTCADPGVPENGYRLGNRFYVGSVARFWCRRGYELVGARFIICEEDTQDWTARLPECVESFATDDDNTQNIQINEDRELAQVLDSSNKISKADMLVPESFHNKDNRISGQQDIIMHDTDTDITTNNYKSGMKWLCSVFVSTSATPRCSCAFICSDWVLVPATCLQEWQDNYIKLLEPGDIMVHSTEERLKVLKIYRHPKYFFGHHGHDVAVLKTEKRLVTSDPDVIDIAGGKFPTPPLVECVLYENHTVTEVTLQQHHECPQTGPYRLSSDTVCIQHRVDLGTPLITRWKFPDEPERSFLLAVAKVQNGTLFTDIRKHQRWVLDATEGCNL